MSRPPLPGLGRFGGWTAPVATSRARAAGALGALLPALLAGACGGPPAAAPGEPPSAPGPAARPIDPPAAAGSLAPNLTAAGGEVLLSWLEPLAGERHRLQLARLGGGGWSSPVTITEGEGFFANWADLPAVVESGDGSLIVHWLAKTDAGTYDYSIYLARSLDGGAAWTELGPLNDDGVAAEHGFVSYAREPGGLRAFWLDGREMPAGGAMTLRTAAIGETVGASELLDERVCECCSTDAAAGRDGPLVVYRDRGAEEVRDVSIVRRSGGGWTTPAPAGGDGWKIAGCPVNGPAVAAGAGGRLALAWFTAAGEAPRVQLALSADAGATFGPPRVIDADSPPGRVDVVADGAGGAVVSWLAASGGAGAVRLRRAAPDGELGPPLEIATTGAGRASGFPRLLRRRETLYLAWVDTLAPEGHRLRAAAVPLSALLAPGRNASGASEQAGT